MNEREQEVREHAEIDMLMDEVLAEMANPSATKEWINRLHQEKTMATMDNVLVFGSFEKLGKTGGMSMSKQSLTTAALLNIAAALLLFAFVAQAKQLVVTKDQVIAVLTAPPVPPPIAPRTTAMGGGGGNPGLAPVTHGNPPAFAPQLVPLKAPPTIEPKLAVQPTVDVQKDLKMAPSDVPTFGVPSSPLAGMSLGNGKGGGIGSGNGGGIGPGIGGNMGGGLRAISGGVSAPVVLFAPEPEFSEEARKAKVAGNVLVYLQVDTLGRPTHVRVMRGIGLGLDEKAAEAVRGYRFKPAMENGHPVPVEMQVEVGFQIF